MGNHAYMSGSAKMIVGGQSHTPKQQQLLSSSTIEVCSTNYGDKRLRVLHAGTK